MEDIREVLEMLEPTPEVLATLREYGTYIILTKWGLREVIYCTYTTVPPKFQETCRSPSRYTMDAVKYIFKVKEE